MRNNYPTFPNPAGIGSGLGYNTPPAAPEQMLPDAPHPQIVLKPQPGEKDPVLASDTYYKQQTSRSNPWVRASE